MSSGLRQFVGAFGETGNWEETAVMFGRGGVPTCEGVFGLGRAV